jgi:hypothetical protein
VRLINYPHIMKSLRTFGATLAVGAVTLVPFISTLPALAAASAPAISINAPSPTPFSTATVSGSGFAANETVHVSLGLASASATASASGSFSGVTLSIPNLPSGLYLVVATGQTSGLQTFGYLYINQLAPQVSPSSWYIAPGTTLSFSGSGFAPNEVVTVSNGASTTANSSGNFASAGGSTVPLNARNSTQTYTLHGATSGAVFTLPISVADLYPYTNPSTWYALPGNAVSFSGGGFGPGEVVNVFVGASTTPVASFSADSSGAFMSAGATTLPFNSGTSVNYRLVGAQSGATALAPVTLAQFYPSIAPSVWYSAPGGSATLTGSGFAPNESVSITSGSNAPVTATADAMGNISAPAFALPTMPNSMGAITAVGNKSGASVTVYVAIGAYYPWLNLSTYWAQGGSALTIIGGGFAPNESVALSTTQGTFATGHAGPDGALSIATAVPFAMPGATTITALGGTSGVSTTINMTVAPVYTDLQLGSYAGEPGTGVHFIGHGYIPNEPVNITTDRTGTTVVRTIVADATGSFDDSGYIVPAGSTEGNLTLTATGTHSFNSKSITYYVTGM